MNFLITLHSWLFLLMICFEGKRGAVIWGMWFSEWPCRIMHSLYLARLPPTIVPAGGMLIVLWRKLVKPTGVAAGCEWRWLTEEGAGYAAAPALLVFAVLGTALQTHPRRLPIPFTELLRSLLNRVLRLRSVAKLLSSPALLKLVWLGQWWNLVRVLPLEV